MPNIRKPTPPKESLPAPGSRSERLRNLIQGGGDWYGNDNISLVYWSQELGGRWVMWEDPDALAQQGIGIDP